MVRWGLYRDRGRWVIRRGKERLPTAKYHRIRHDELLLREYVDRLNAPLRVKEAVKFKHAFISPALLAEYQEWLEAQIPTKRNAQCEYTYLEEYFLNYFIGQLNLSNPLDWFSVHATKWAKFLLSDVAPKSAKTKRAIVQAANRFMGWLHKKRPEEVPPLVFQPLSRAVYKDIEAARQMRGERKERRAISDVHWKEIRRSLSEEPIRPLVLLGYFYGLRRSECLGVRPEDVRQGHLCVERQLGKLGTYFPPKGRGPRKVPHWFARASDAYAWAEDLQKALMHPDTLTDRWNALMVALDLDYDFHDLRHTFITKSVRKHPVADVMYAAGHKDLKTTSRYVHDARPSDDAPFKPAA
jgi:integrase